MKFIYVISNGECEYPEACTMSESSLDSSAHSMKGDVWFSFFFLFVAHVLHTNKYKYVHVNMTP